MSGNENACFGILLFDTAWDELGDAVAPYAQKGPIGRFLYCNNYSVVGSFVELTFTPDQCSEKVSEEMTVWIPAGFVKFVATVTDSTRKGIGFISE